MPGPISYFALSGSCLTVPWALGPVLMFCAFGLVFGCIEGAEFIYIYISISLFRYNYNVLISL
jgi:hypothetical protein